MGTTILFYREITYKNKQYEIKQKINIIYHIMFVPCFLTKVITYMHIRDHPINT